MRPIIIGAGRGSRLGPNTDDIPKALVPVMGKPMLEWILDALETAGFARKDVVFICGYRAEVVKARYPEFTFVDNVDWENNNILGSLMCARRHFGEGFVSTYADIVYRGAARSKASPSSRAPAGVNFATPMNSPLACSEGMWRESSTTRGPSARIFSPSLSGCCERST